MEALLLRRCLAFNILCVPQDAPWAVVLVAPAHRHYIKWQWLPCKCAALRTWFQIANERRALAVQELSKRQPPIFAVCSEAASQQDIGNINVLHMQDIVHKPEHMSRVGRSHQARRQHSAAPTAAWRGAAATVP